MQIDVIVRPKSANADAQSVYQFKTLADAGAFISDIFGRFGNDLVVAVAIDGKPVNWHRSDQDLVIDGAIPS